MKKIFYIFLLLIIYPIKLLSQPISDFVIIAPGEYSIGNISNNDVKHNDEEPVHTVILTKHFMICKYETTVSQWLDIMGYLPELAFKGEMLPITGTDWYEAIEYCNKLSEKHQLQKCYTRNGKVVTWDTSANGFRLPTNAEWEIACRVGTTTDYYTGNQTVKHNCTPLDISFDKAGWYCGNSNNTLQPVGLKIPNLYGLYDMHGNAWEWCWDSYDADYYQQFSNKPAVNPMGPNWNNNKVLRSGSFDNIANYGRSSDRNSVSSNSKYTSTGIRLVVGACDESAFDYPDFSSVEGLELVGTAVQNDKAIALTESENWQRGAVWLKQPIPVQKGFTTHFSFRFSDGADGIPDGFPPGADGIAFVIRGKNSNHLGRSGYGIAYEDIANCLAVEFDTYYNTFSNQNKINKENALENVNDPNGNHIAIMSRGKSYNKPFHDLNTVIAQTDTIQTIKIDGTIYHCKIDYNIIPNTMRVYLDTTKNFNQPALVASNLNLDELLELYGGTHAIIGFTASTGDSREKHEILDWSSCPMPEENIVSVENNRISTAYSINNVNIYPNPFEKSAVIEFSNTIADYIRIEIFNTIGMKVDEVFSGYIPAGLFKTEWNAARFESGLYYAKISTSKLVSIATLCLIR